MKKRLRSTSPESRTPKPATNGRGGASVSDWDAVTPVNNGERESFILSPSETLGLSPGQIFHQEESILIAQKGSERYRSELEREIERSNEFISKVSALEAAKSTLQNELDLLQGLGATRERDLLKQLEALATAKRRDEQKFNDTSLKLEEKMRELQESNRKLHDEVELSKVREEGIKRELEDLKSRKNTSMEDSIKIMQSLCTSLRGSDGQDHESSRKLEELSILNKNLAKENQTNALEARASAQLKKEVEKLRGIQDEADRHRSRCEKLQQVPFHRLATSIQRIIFIKPAGFRDAIPCSSAAMN